MADGIAQIIGKLIALENHFSRMHALNSRCRYREFARIFDVAEQLIAAI